MYDDDPPPVLGRPLLLPSVLCLIESSCGGVDAGSSEESLRLERAFPSTVLESILKKKGRHAGVGQNYNPSAEVVIEVVVPEVVEPGDKKRPRGSDAPEVPLFVDDRSDELFEEVLVFLIDAPLVPSEEGVKAVGALAGSTLEYL